MTRNRANEHANYKDFYETPPGLYVPLAREFDGFSMDLAASKNNAIASEWCGPGHPTRPDSLAVNWHMFGGTLWLNPPYGKGMAAWVQKAWDESMRGAFIVSLLPANTDSGWFHDWVLGRAELRWVRGRVQFLIDGQRPKRIDKKTGKEVNSGNTGSSVIAIYRPFGIGR